MTGHKKMGMSAFSLSLVPLLNHESDDGCEREIYITYHVSLGGESSL